MEKKSKNNAGEHKEADIKNAAKVVYFIRHGESEENVSGVIHGGEARLSEIGEAEARLAAGRFAESDIEVVLSSDMERARKTALLVAAAAEKPLIENPIWRELLAPTAFWGRHISDAEFVDFLRDERTRADDETWCHSDEETFAELKARAVQALQILEARPERAIAVVTHGTFLRALVGTMLLGEDFTPPLLYALKNTFSIKNTGVTAAIYGTLPYAFIGGCPTHGWRLIAWNDHSHLV